MKSVRYMELSHSIVAGPRAASCMTEDTLGLPIGVEVEEERDFPAYRPTAAESTRLRRGSDTQMRKVVATKNMIRL